jgi:hypothetical protein
MQAVLFQQQEQLHHEVQHKLFYLVYDPELVLMLYIIVSMYLFRKTPK